MISTDCVYHDVDCTAIGREPGELIGEPVARNADPTLTQIAYKAAQLISQGSQVHIGRIVSGDQFIASAEKVSWLRNTFDAACTEMEGAATAHICDRLTVPFVVVRSISDSADSTAHTDFPAFLQMAAIRGLAFAKAYLELSNSAEILNNS
ncbi:MAG: 5'-methylthioadenosine/S-adenosylhomocysteine nucleosidase [Propionibacteriaceae bacterium]